MSTDLFSVKYHPKSIDEMVLSDTLKEDLTNILNDVPNITLAGPPGIGKSTFVDIIINHNKMDVLRINASDETGVDSIRDKVKSFSTAVGFSDQLKVVYLNECDALSLQAQKMLRGLIEQVFDITRFIMVCNYPEKMIPELVSRCPITYFDTPPLMKLAKHCQMILNAEKIEYDLKDVISIIKIVGTDVRHTLNTIQLNIIDGKLKSNPNVTSTNDVYETVISQMKTGDPASVRKVLRSNAIDYTRLYDYIYTIMMDSEEDVFKNDMVGLLLVTEASYRNEIVSIKEINFMNMLIKMLKDGVL